MEHSAFIGNQALGGDDNNGGSFAPRYVVGTALGGAILVTRSPVNPSGLAEVTDCTFAFNQAVGGARNLPGTYSGPPSPFSFYSSVGGAFGGARDHRWRQPDLDQQYARPQPGDRRGRRPGQAGGDGEGGGVGTRFGGGALPPFYGGMLTMTNNTLNHNQALGGRGGSNGDGGHGRGGGVFDDSDGATLSDNRILQNQAVGGGGRGGDGGDGQGGGVYNDAAGVMVSGGFLSQNQAVGGAGGDGVDGGDGQGGGLCTAPLIPIQVSVTVSGSRIDHNDAIGGAGGSGGRGGDGLGGGFYNGGSSTLTLTVATVEYNLALGGEAGSGGSEGQGAGGGVYTLGTFSFDTKTDIKKNHASTSNDDIGP